MADQFNKFIRVLEALQQHDVEYILIGGVAVILYGSERLTRDIDIIINPMPENIDKLKKALYAVFKDHAIGEISAEELRKYSVIRYGTPDGFYIDIIERIGEIASFKQVEFEIIDYHGIKISIAKPEALYHLKKDSIRPRDQMDTFFLQQLIEYKNSGNNEL